MEKRLTKTISILISLDKSIRDRQIIEMKKRNASISYSDMLSQLVKKGLSK